jgi:hypothetical protein
MGTCATNHGIKKNTPNHGKKNHPVVKGQSDTTTRGWVACNIIHVLMKRVKDVCFIIIIIIISISIIISIH